MVAVAVWHPIWFCYYCKAYYAVAWQRVLVDVLFMLVLNKPLASLPVNVWKKNTGLQFTSATIFKEKKKLDPIGDGFLC